MGKGTGGYMSDMIYITDLQMDAEVTISCRLHDKTADFKGKVSRVSDTFVCLDIPLVDGKALTFDGVSTSITGMASDGLLYKFSDCMIGLFKGVSVAKCVKAGKKVNRRGSFRIGISVVATLIRNGDDPTNVYIKDVSATGYAITTAKPLNVGEEICVKFTDMGMSLVMIGRIVRMEEHEDKNVYGVQLSKQPPNLEAYITNKQREILRKKRG